MKPPAWKPGFVLAAAALTALLSAGVCVASVLARAPAPVLPMVVAVCVGCPMFAAWELPRAVAAIRLERSGGRAMARFRRTLEQLPETEHPLGL